VWDKDTNNWEMHNSKQISCELGGFERVPSLEMEVRLMPNLGMPELLIILVIFMLIFGVGKLPVVRRWI